jgi:hypothetical protein
MREALRMLAAGTLLGLVILGVGGRLAMAAIAIGAGQPSRWSLGGSMTVVFLGAVSGLAGAAIALTARFLTRPWRRWPWVHHTLFSIVLLLLTVRGLRGTGPAGHWYFFVLVGLYGTALAVILARNRGTNAQQGNGSLAQDIECAD